MTVSFPDDFNLADYFLFDRLGEGKGDKVAIRFGDRAWTYAEVAARAEALARMLVAHGLRPEERVYIVLPDVPPFAWSIFATLAAGGILTMGNPAAPPEDLAYVLDYVKAAALIRTVEIDVRVVATDRVDRLGGHRRRDPPSCLHGIGCGVIRRWEQPTVRLGSRSGHTVTAGLPRSKGWLLPITLAQGWRRPGVPCWLLLRQSGLAQRVDEAPLHRYVAIRKELFQQRQ